MNASAKILIVDDSINVINDLEITLENDEKEVVTAGNGKEGLSILSSDSAINLCITDLNMPEMNGFEMIEQFRQQCPDRNIPIIMLTTEMNREARQKGKSLGVTGWIVKPFDGRELVECINVLLNKVIQ